MIVCSIVGNRNCSRRWCVINYLIGSFCPLCRLHCSIIITILEFWSKEVRTFILIYEAGGSYQIDSVPASAFANQKKFGSSPSPSSHQFHSWIQHGRVFCDMWFLQFDHVVIMESLWSRIFSKPRCWIKAHRKIKAEYGVKWMDRLLGRDFVAQNLMTSLGCVRIKRRFVLPSLKNFQPPLSLWQCLYTNKPFDIWYRKPLYFHNHVGRVINWNSEKQH